MAQGANSLAPSDLDEAALDRLTQGLKDSLSKGGTVGDWLGYSRSELEALYIIGWRLYEMGDYEAAAVSLHKLVTLDPLERRYLQALAAATQMAGQYKQAVAHYGMLMALDAEDPMPTYHMAHCLIKLGQAGDAAEVLEATIDNANGKPEFAELREQAIALRTLLRGQTAAVQGA